jgi:CIC family chloride channel protein
MEHIVPPRDLQGWQNLPVLAIAHFDPVVAQGLELPALHEIMKHSYSRFPVVERGCLVGMLSRAKIQTALDQGSVPRPSAAFAVRPGQAIREVQHLLIESEDGIIVVTDREDGRPLAVAEREGM